MEVEEEGKNGVVCPLPCNLASLLSMNCRTRAEGLARRLQSHLKPNCTSDLEGTWLVQTGGEVRISSSEGRTYSLDDHQLESFKRASDLKGLRPIHVVTSEPTLHLCLPSKPSQDDLVLKSDHEQDSDVYYDFDLVTPPEDYANPGPSRIASHDVIPEEGEKHERPESGCVTSVTSPIMFSDDPELESNHPPSPFDDSSHPELMSNRGSDVDFEAVRELLTSSRFGGSFEDSENQIFHHELKNGRPKSESCSSSSSTSDDVDMHLYYNEFEALENFMHAKETRPSCSIFSPPVSTFQTFAKFDTTLKNHVSKPPVQKRKKLSKRKSENSYWQSNSADKSPAANKIQRDSQTRDLQADNNFEPSRQKHEKLLKNKIPPDLMRSHSLEGAALKERQRPKSITAAHSLDKLSRGILTRCEISSELLDLAELPLHQERKLPGSIENLPQLPEERDNVPLKGSTFNPFVDSGFEEHHESETSLANRDSIYRKIVTESRDISEPPDEKRQLSANLDSVFDLSTLDGNDIVQDIDKIIERLKTTDGAIGKKLANYEDKQNENIDSCLCEKEVPAEGTEQVVTSYICCEFGAHDRCQEEPFASSKACHLCEKQVPFESNINVVRDEVSEGHASPIRCHDLHDNKDFILTELQSPEDIMPEIGGQIKVKRAKPDAKPPQSLGIAELSEVSCSSLSEPISPTGEQASDERCYHEQNKKSANLQEHRLDSDQCSQEQEVSCSDSVKPERCDQSQFNENKYFFNDISDESSILQDPNSIINESYNQPTVNGHTLDSQYSLTNSFKTPVSFLHEKKTSNVDLLENFNIDDVNKCAVLNDNFEIKLEDIPSAASSSSPVLISHSDIISDQNNDTYHKACIKNSTNPFLKEIVESFPGETFHLVNNNGHDNHDGRFQVPENIDGSVNVSDNDNFLNSHSEDEHQLLRQLFNQSSQPAGTDVSSEKEPPIIDSSPGHEDSNGRAENEIDSLNITAESGLSDQFAQSQCENSNDLTYQINSIMLSDNIPNKSGDANGVDDIHPEIDSPSKAGEPTPSEEDTALLKGLDNDILEPEINGVPSNGTIVTETDNNIDTEIDDVDNISENVSATIPESQVPNATFGGGCGTDQSFFVAIEEPGALCLVQTSFSEDSRSSANNKDNILVRRDSAERDIQVEMDKSNSVAPEAQCEDDDDVIETLPEVDGAKDDESEESDEEIVLSGKFQNLQSYYEKETIHHISEEDGTLPPPPTEVILIDFDEPADAVAEARAAQNEVCGSTLAEELVRLEMEEPSVQPPSSDSERSSEEREQDSGDMQLRIKRSSSLKCGKTPPGTPGRKKIVRFADALGLDLAAIRTYLDGVPNVPPSAFCDLQVEQDAPETLPQNQGFPSFASYSAAASAAAAALQNQARRILTPMFQQPGALPDFYDRLREQKVILENVSIGSDLSVKGVVRVVNEDFHKKVHIRYTFDHWKNHHEATATYVDGSSDGFSDRFSFLLWGSFLQSNGALIFCVKYSVKGREFWDSNRGSNYVLQCYSTPPIPLAAVPAVEQSQHLMGRPQNNGNINGAEPSGNRHSNFRSQNQQNFNSFMDDPSNTPSDPWITRFF